MLVKGGISVMAVGTSGLGVPVGVKTTVLVSMEEVSSVLMLVTGSSTSVSSNGVAISQWRCRLM